jgi:hypothetical protein
MGKAPVSAQQLKWQADDGQAAADAAAWMVNVWQERANYSSSDNPGKQRRAAHIIRRRQPDSHAQADDGVGVSFHGSYVSLRRARLLLSEATYRQ